MPALDSIVDVKPLTPGADGPQSAAAGTARAAPGPGSRYRIIVTNEVDEYEEGATAIGTLDFAFAARAAGDDFEGTARRAAKLSIARADIEEFSDLRELIEALTPDEDMVRRKPRISTGARSGRVAEERRNVRVRAFLYAASREDDNDFHLIIGRHPDDTPEMYMTMELSGLPPKRSASFRQLNAARDAYKAFFGDNLPGFAYEFPDPPVPVEIEGSLFFDMSHAQGIRPGPKSLKSRMPTIWEVHPITRIVFEP